MIRGRDINSSIDSVEVLVYDVTEDSEILVCHAYCVSSIRSLRASSVVCGADTFTFLLLGR